MRNFEFEKNSDIPVDVFVKQRVLDKINELVHENPKKECGAYFIGNTFKDNVSGKISVYLEDLYSEKQFGTSSTFAFEADYGLRAKGYAMTKCKGCHIVGNIHSHAQFEPFFSGVDRAMMEESKDDSFYMVVSPRYGTWTGVFKDSDFNYHDVNLKIVSENTEDKLFGNKDAEGKFGKKIEYNREKTVKAGMPCTVDTFRTERNYTDLQQKEFDKRFLYSQKEFEGKRLLIVGAGTIGSALACFAMNNGISDITIVDYDKYEFYNRPRTMLIDDDSIGKLKALELARQIAERSSFSIKVRGINADIYNLGWGFFKDFDLVLSPVDSIDARHYIDRGCRLYGVNHITCGTGEVFDDLSGNILCIPKNARVDLDYMWGAGYRKKLDEHRSCSDVKEETQSQVMGFSAVIAGETIGLAAKYLLGKMEEDVALKYVVNSLGHGYERDNAAIRAGRKTSVPEDVESELFDVWNKDEPIVQIEFDRKRPKSELWEILNGIFKEDELSYVLNLEWSMNKPVAYRSTGAVAKLEVTKEAGVDETFERLPEEHIYKVETTNNDYLVKIVLTDNEE